MAEQFETDIAATAAAFGDAEPAAKSALAVDRRSSSFGIGLRLPCWTDAHRTMGSSATTSSEVVAIHPVSDCGGEA